MELSHRAAGAGKLSHILKREMKVSTGLMNRLKWEDRILVNGVPQRTNFPVQPGDTVTLRMDEPEPEYPGEEMELSILYEDEHLIALDKPAGMLIHPSPHRDTGTLANGVIGYYQKKGLPCAFHPVTRLDRDTFGVVLIAKNSHAHGLLNDCHRAGKLRKTYEALVYGCPEPEQGIIDAPIARLPLPSLLRRVDPEGKPSVTEYRVVEKFGGYSLVELRPVTGRTHQLRVHCAYIGCPILGDPQYGSAESQAFSARWALEYQRLCASSIEFDHPITGEHLVIRSKLTAGI